MPAPRHRRRCCCTAGQDDTVWPRNSIHLDAKLRSLGVPSELKIYPQLGHVGIITAFARPFRNKAPVLADLTASPSG